MNVREIIRGHLKANGYCGLYHTDSEFAFTLDRLFTCESQDARLDCEPGVCMDHDAYDSTIGPRKTDRKEESC